MNFLLDLLMSVPYHIQAVFELEGWQDAFRDPMRIFRIGSYHLALILPMALLAFLVGNYHMHALGNFVWFFVLYSLMAMGFTWYMKGAGSAVLGYLGISIYALFYLMIPYVAGYVTSRVMPRVRVSIEWPA